MSGYFAAAPRPLTRDDTEAARAIVLGTLGVTPYLDRAMELLTAAESGDSETQSLVIERDGTIAALALFGPVAGAKGTWRIDDLLLAPRVDVREVGPALVEAVAARAVEAGARLLVAELPADPALGKSLSLLRASGFSQEGRISDFFRDGVALLFLRLDL